MNQTDMRYIRADSKRDPQAYAADQHDRNHDNAEHELWMVVHRGDIDEIDKLMQQLHDTYRTSDAEIINQVFIDALSRVKEYDESAAGALWDRLVGIIEENAQ